MNNKIKFIKIENGLWDVSFNGEIRGRMNKVGMLICRMDNGAEIKASNMDSVKRLLDKHFK